MYVSAGTSSVTSAFPASLVASDNVFGNIISSFHVAVVQRVLILSCHVLCLLVFDQVSVDFDHLMLVVGDEIRDYDSTGFGSFVDTSLSASVVQLF